MFHRGLAAFFLGMALVGATDATAQGSSTSVEQDVKRREQIERRIDDPKSGISNPGGVQSDPSGVAGTSGPPGVVGGTVNSYAPLPPGAPGNEVR